VINLRLAVPAILAAAAVAACFTYFVSPPAPIEADKVRSIPPNLIDRSDTMASINIDPRPSAETEAAAAYRQAAEAILRRASNARADAGADEPITGLIPLPKRRPITHP
jgi:hypothetical protein